MQRVTLAVVTLLFATVSTLPALCTPAVPGFEETTVVSGLFKGYRYKDPQLLNGPISLAMLTNGKLVKAIGKGTDLGHSVGTLDPTPVDIVLTTGTRRFCMSFGGAAHLVPGKTFTAVDAPAPGACHGP